MFLHNFLHNVCISFWCASFRYSNTPANIVRNKYVFITKFACWDHGSPWLQDIAHLVCTKQHHNITKCDSFAHVVIFYSGGCIRSSYPFYRLNITIDLLLCDWYGICITQMSRSDRWVDNVVCILKGNKMENPLKSDNCFPGGQQYITPLHIIHSNRVTFKYQILCYWSILEITVSFYEMACYFFRVRGNGIISQSSNIFAIWCNKIIFNWFSFDISLYRLLDKQQKYRCFEVLIPPCDVIVNVYPILNEMHPPNNYGVTCYPK